MRVAYMKDILTFAPDKEKNMWIVFLYSLLLIGLAMLLLSIRVLLKRNGRFRSFHIHDSKAMRERGIDCVIEQDRKARE